MLSNMSAVPWVHTISYGDDEDSLSVAYMNRINIEFMKAGLRGISMLFASGKKKCLCGTLFHHHKNITFYLDVIFQ